LHSRLWRRTLKSLATHGRKNFDLFCSFLYSSMACCSLASFAGLSRSLGCVIVVVGNVGKIGWPRSTGGHVTIPVSFVAPFTKIPRPHHLTHARLLGPFIHFLVGSKSIPDISNVAFLAVSKYGTIWVLPMQRTRRIGLESAESAHSGTMRCD